MSERSLAPSGMTLRQLELLCAVADLGSFSGAAQAMYLTPNAVSLAVTELETHLGVQLCVRQRARGVSLTPAGLKVVDRARRLLRDASELQRAAANSSESLRGSVKVGCYSTLAPVVVPALLRDFTRRNAGVEVTCVDGRTLDLVLRLRSGELDVVVTYESALPIDLQQEVLFSSEPQILLPADSPLARHERIELKALAGEPLILMDLPPSGDNTLQLLNAAGVRPHIAHRSESPEVVRSLVGLGLGYSLVYQKYQPETGVEVAGAISIPVERGVGATDVVVCWAPGHNLHDEALAVVDFMRVDLSAKLAD